MAKPPAENPPQVAEALARGDATALAALSESNDKALAKAARRALHLLRTKGISTPELPPPKAMAPAATLREPEAEAPCLVSSIDGGGERAVWLARAEPQGGILVFEAYVHEINGITQFRVSELTRKSFRNVLRELTAEKRSFTIARFPWRYARAEVEAAERRNKAQGRALPVEYARAKQQLGKAEPLATHPALELWPQADEVPVKNMVALHETSECRPWVPDADDLERTAMRLDEVEQSQLLVNAQQKISARQGALARAAREAYADAARVERMRTRLLDTAYLLAQLGPDRQADARAARAVAEVFVPGGSPGDHPFTVRLYEKCFPPSEPGGAEGKAGEAADAARTGERSPGGLILPP
jgi:hypothetical protein